MADRSLRGTRLGAISLEDEDTAALAPRHVVIYDCPEGHSTSVPMADEAEVPALWECRTCGAEALRRGGQRPEEKPQRHIRTHWDMLIERRSVADLEELLTERLDLLHETHRAAKRSA